MPERYAYVCASKDCVPPVRVFLLAEPDRPPACPEHRGRMIRQTNVEHDPASSGRGPRRVSAPRRPPSRNGAAPGTAA